MRSLARLGYRAWVHASRMLGIEQSEARRMRDAAEHWSRPDHSRWRSDSHWRGAEVFTTDEAWLAVGREHLKIAERLVPAALSDDPRPVILEWGVGGGTNAVAFAPRARQFIAVEVSSESLKESGQQVSRVCSTPYVPVLVDIGRPEEAMQQVRDGCDLYLSFYVFELAPSKSYALRLLEVAHRLVRTGGFALIQVKYATVDRKTWSIGVDYRRNLGDMTSFPIDEFWLHTVQVGFTPLAVHLVPSNEFGGRYAYFALQKQA